MLRLSPEAFATLQQKISAGLQASGRVAVSTARRGKNKYGAEACEIDGRRFDSKAEGRRYLLLRDMERRGEITSLECQVSFELIPAQEIGGRKGKPVRYVADFRYTRRDGRQVVEDVKSGPTKTREFIIKRKLMAMVHGIEVVEVMVDD